MTNLQRLLQLDTAIRNKEAAIHELEGFHTFNVLASQRISQLCCEMRQEIQTMYDEVYRLQGVAA